MAYLRTKNAVLLAKIEAAEGVAETLSASTDAVKVENPQINFNPNLINTNETSGSLDDDTSIVGGMTVGVTFVVNVKGAAQAGVAPEWGKVLKACGFAETVLAAAVPVASEAAAAGGSSTLAILGTTASSNAGTYDGMPIALTNGVAGDSFISKYLASKNAQLTDTMGGAIDAGTNYQIPKCVRYAPASNSIPSLTFELFKDGVKYKIAGARGTVTAQVQAGGIMQLQFNFTGLFVSKTDASVPTPTYDTGRPPVFRDAVFKINRLVAAISGFSIQTGSQIVNPDNPNAQEGFDAAQITRRKISGTMDPAETLVATRDIITAFRAGNTAMLHARFGKVAGNRLAITVPAALYTGYEPGDRNGIAAESTPFEASGADSGFYLTVY